MRILFLGDTHGQFEDLTIWDGKVDAIVQVGDFGWWPNFPNWVPPAMEKTPVYFICGNHEDHDELDKITVPTEIAKNITYQPRGSILTLDGRNILCMGGAFSDDYKYRTIGIDWFSQEGISDTQLDLAIENVQSAKIDVVVSHDCPAGFGTIPGSHHEDVHAPRHALQTLLEHIDSTPHTWFFGHHHRLIEGAYRPLGWWQDLDWKLCPIASRERGWLWDTTQRNIEIITAR